MISKTKINERTRRKTHSEIVDTVRAAKKHKAWLELAKKISGPRKAYKNVNLRSIDTETKAGDTVVVVGKVLGSGEVSKKVRVCALSVSQSAEEKLRKHQGEVVTILEEINKNPKAEGVRLL